MKRYAFGTFDAGMGIRAGTCANIVHLPNIISDCIRIWEMYLFCLHLYVLVVRPCHKASELHFTARNVISVLSNRERFGAWFPPLPLASKMIDLIVIFRADALIVDHKFLRSSSRAFISIPVHSSFLPRGRLPAIRQEFLLGWGLGSVYRVICGAAARYIETFPRKRNKISLKLHNGGGRAILASPR